ncbi:pro-sigmaK processing inhibitor BofA family protein [Paenibacillus koleovorans]|uniref:pro-sigmaK processing inhibitor BofA family protein n=1 Tax=Paenibacillus koleovorans TaxID=121608 RepID=UPI000FDC6A92|nr:pro-sigmaK processing inhibitor BofA family protein [Paenibacillus koleovorans]
MNWFFMGMFLVSSLLLVLLLLRNRHARRWSSYVLLHIVVAAILLYAINLLSVYTDFRIPINVPTVASVVVLGVPGLLMLMAMKWFLL